ncbi:MAG TPA: hypothetical protein VF384_18595 [Planctomycetota bacterium]
MTDPTADLESLLLRTEWLQRMAHRLCADHHLAEDGSPRGGVAVEAG